MSERKNIFVFVVCGADEHIRTLNFSLRYLRHFSDNDIIVVTDLKRNTLDIEHEDVREVTTPLEYSHHQASIYLKTSLHKTLDLELNNYCYLDSDVIAASTEVDNIFTQSFGPITFAHDHCALDVFSPNAINCDCLVESKVRIELLDKLSQDFEDKCKPSDPELYKKFEEVIRLLDRFGEQTEWFGKNTLIRLMLSVAMPSKYNFTKFLKSQGNFEWNKKERKVYDSDGKVIYDDAYQFPDFIENNSTFKYDKGSKTWYDQEGKEVYITSCSHLAEAIQSKFTTNISDEKWQHWNGGVFLFNKDSIEFMDLWLDKTTTIFEDPLWKVRDQGTLVATVWELNLQNQQCLPGEYNFLADYHMSNLNFDVDKGFSYDNFETIIQPHFYHIYHHFGDKSWEVWQQIESLLPQTETVQLDDTNAF